jgi:hypothetical protein
MLAGGVFVAKRTNSQLVYLLCLPSILVKNPYNSSFIARLSSADP